MLLELAVGGAHNDTLILLVLAAALALTAGRHPRFRAAAVALVAGIGIKVTAGLALPSWCWRRRVRASALRWRAPWLCLAASRHWG